ISFAHRVNIGLPIAYAMIQPSLVRNRSDGADVCPRFSVGIRLTWIACCSTSVGLLNAIAVRSSAPSTFCPRPFLPRSISAASGGRRGSEVHHGAGRGVRLTERAVHVRSPANALADPVEAVLVAPRSASAESGDGGEDDVRLPPPQAVEIERQRAQDFGRQI